MASEGGPDAEFHDPVRIELLQTLQTALGVSVIESPTAWVCLWLSDVVRLRSLRTRQSSTASTPQRPSIPQGPYSAQLSSPAQQPSHGQLANARSKKQKDLCYERDHKKCVIAIAGESIDVAHIYPFSMRYESNVVNRSTPAFWNTLRQFWSEERVDGYAHKYWSEAYFALKPIRLSNDRKRLDIQFFWIPPRNYASQVGILHRPSLPADLDQGPNLTMLFNNETCKEICSGDDGTLETNDPVSLPLPDFRVLEMQWYLHRVTAMNGAAELQDDFCGGGDDSDDDLTIVE
ncbi:hypothetical protein K432DRAFT_406469 [Lepidopterella palustris CBS 459.81]|uniref:HNH nuclease domain-containing protein n=1 Tax=Lepidopterella palustris CBS 459.81 TaxID=1314670 RepID=A0A8E2E712_9PEZI|nr:hypothetical protein K432DRAFT_406469 [Lepidopterella palustris CBS 459.81]